MPLTGPGKTKNIDGQNFAQKFAALLSQYEDGKRNGNVRFVNSANGTDTAGFGFSPDAPFKTINFASTQMAADNDDLIIVMPGHTETITAAGGITLGVAGVTVQAAIGAVGRKAPTINYTTANTASLLVSAARVTIQGLYIKPTGFAAVAKPVDVQAADCTIQNCEFELTNATNQAVCGISADNGVATADRLRVQNNWFHGTTDAGTAKAITVVGTDGLTILDNVMQGAYTTSIGGIENVTTACTNANIGRNKINNTTASSTKAMVFAAASTGQIYENRMQILSGTAPITGAAMSWVGGNYYAAAIATAGTLI